MALAIISAAVKYTDFIADTIKDLEGFTGVPFKGVKVATRQFAGFAPATYNPVTKEMLFKPRLIEFWAVNEVDTKKVLKFIIGHEYFHYVQDVRGQLPVGYRIRLVQRWKIQDEADAFAQSYSGISKEESESLMLSLYMKPFSRGV